MSSTLVKSVRFKGKRINSEENIMDRQERVPGFSQEKESQLRIIGIGAGGLGGEIYEGLIRKGIRWIKMFDNDVVTPTNLNRQRFYEKDLYKNKAICLGENLVNESVNGTIIMSYPYTFQHRIEEGDDMNCDVVICGVDNNATRIFVSKYFYERNVPVIFTAVSETANNGYCFVQEPGKACFGCLFPEVIDNGKEPCPGVPAVKDILKVVSGLVLYAIDSLFMDRKRNWNYKEIFLAGFVPSADRQIRRMDNCKICGNSR